MEKLADLRESRALTLRDLAQLSGVDANTINQVELGHRKPRPSTLRKLARALEVTPEELAKNPALPKVPAPTWPQPAEERRKAEAFLRAHPDEGGRIAILEEVARGYQRWADSWYQQAERYEREGIAFYGRAREVETMFRHLTERPTASGLAAYVSEVESGARRVSKGEAAACEKSAAAIARLRDVMQNMQRVNEAALGKAATAAELLDSDLDTLEEPLPSEK